MPILVVDDEEANALLLERMLEREGFENVTVSCDPGRVPALFAKHRPQLVLLDLHMPGLDGFEVMRILEPSGDPNQASVPIVILTADVKVEPRRRALRWSGSRVPVVRLAERVALTHHERWDGTGYRNGLSGEEVALLG